MFFDEENDDFMTGAAAIFMFGHTVLPMLYILKIYNNYIYIYITICLIWETEHERWAAKMESEEAKWHVADQPINAGDDRVALLGPRLELNVIGGTGLRAMRQT